MRCAAYLLSWTTSPLCPLASRVVAWGNKPADIVVSTCNSDTGASLNQSGPGTCRRHRQLLGTSLCSPRPRVYRGRVRAVYNGPPIHFSSCLISIHFSIYVYFNHFISFPSMSIFNHFMSNLNPLSSFSSCLISITDVYFQSLLMSNCNPLMSNCNHI